MKRFATLLSSLALLAVSAGADAATTGVKITEWMYSPIGSPGEFVEFTNFGPTAVDFTGWSFDDDSRAPGSESLSSFGLVAPGESVIFTEASAAAFRTAWGLADGVKVIGGSLNNLGRADEINLYDASNALVDRLSFADNGTAGGPRTQGASGEAGSVAAIGANNAKLWVLATVGDKEGSYLSVGNDIGSPGKSSFVTAVPEPGSYAMLLAGLGLCGLMARRRLAN